MAEHTPTPWDWVDEREVPRFTLPIIQKNDGFAIADVRATVRAIGEANAAFIVKAVNAYEMLVKALEEIQDLGEDGATAARLGNIAHAALLSVVGCKQNSDEASGSVAPAERTE